MQNSFMVSVSGFRAFFSEQLINCQAGKIKFEIISNL